MDCGAVDCQAVTDRALFPPEVGGDVAPRARVPLYYRHAEGVGLEPCLGAEDDAVQLRRPCVVL